MRIGTTEDMLVFSYTENPHVQKANGKIKQGAHTIDAI